MLITMSDTELSRLEAIQKIKEKRLKVSHAADLLGVSRRQVHRWILAYNRDGAVGLVSKKRGKPSNRRYSREFRNRIINIVRENYTDFGPTLAREKLAERHDIAIGKETLRRWMTEAGLWQTRKERKKRVHQPRYRRECCGELIQIDGSDHHWFEDRAPRCTLLVYIDDATSRLMHLSFVKSESTFDYMRATQSYIEAHGKPLAFYSDKHGVFRVNAKGALGGDNMTQFGRALKELNIDIICANTPQAKGRVERANGTLQDRLVKELRLEGISDMEAGNVFLKVYMAAHNAKFAKTPFNDKDLHRPLAEHDRMDRALCVKEPRTVSNALTLQYDRVRFILEPNDQSAGLQRKKVMVYDYPDGRIEIRHKGRSLPFTTFDKVRHVDQGAIVSNKRLGAVLAHIQANQEETTHKRSKRAVRRQGQEERIFS